MNQLESLTCKDSLIHRNSHTINTHRLYLPRITLIYKKPRKNLMQVSGALFIYQSLLFCFVQVDAFVAQCHGHQTNIVRILFFVQGLLHQFQVTVNSFTYFFFIFCL